MDTLGDIIQNAWNNPPYYIKEEKELSGTISKRAEQWHKVGLLMESMDEEEFHLLCNNKTFKDIEKLGRDYVTRTGQNRKAGRKHKQRQKQ